MEPNPAPEEIEAPRRRSRSGGRTRHRHGRAWVIALWIILRIGDLPILWLAFRATDPAPQLRNPVIISIIWTTGLSVALWAKQIWARPVNLLFLAYYVFSFGLGITSLIISVARGDVVVIPDRFVILLNGALLYLGVFIALLRSKNIKYLIDPGAKWKERQI